MLRLQECRRSFHFRKLDEDEICRKERETLEMRQELAYCQMASCWRWTALPPGLIALDGPVEVLRTGDFPVSGAFGKLAGSDPVICKRMLRIRVSVNTSMPIVSSYHRKYTTSRTVSKEEDSSSHD